jgi:hypothetical protein
MAEHPVDPDLPGDATFVPTPPRVVIEIGGRGAIAMTVSPEEQAAQHHNRLRYAELGKLRRGQANAYQETRYR